MKIFNMFRKKNNQQKGKTAEELLKELDSQFADTSIDAVASAINQSNVLKKKKKDKNVCIIEDSASIEELEEEEIEEFKQEIEEEKSAKSKKKNNGNGKNKEEVKNTIDVIETTEDKAFLLRKMEIESEKELAIAKLDQQGKMREKIPGYGYLFGIEKEFLLESTTLRPDQAWTFALLLMKENMLNPARTDSLAVMFAHDIMRMLNSIEGKSREQVLMARQQEADKSAASMASTTLFGNNKL